MAVSPPKSYCHLLQNNPHYKVIGFNIVLTRRPINPCHKMPTHPCPLFYILTCTTIHSGKWMYFFQNPFLQSLFIIPCSIQYPCISAGFEVANCGTTIYPATDLKYPLAREGSSHLTPNSNSATASLQSRWLVAHKDNGLLPCGEGLVAMCLVSSDRCPPGLVDILKIRCGADGRLHGLAPCKRIHEGPGFRFPASGFRIPASGFRIPTPWIPDSNLLDSGFQRSRF